MDLTIGSNVIRNTNGILMVEGKAQLSLAWAPLGSELLLTMNLYTAGGKHIARLWRNAWTFNDRERFALTSNPTDVRVIDTTTGAVVVEGRVVGHQAVEIAHGAFYTHAGHRLQITPECWRIGNVTNAGQLVDSHGGAVAIG